MRQHCYLTLTEFLPAGGSPALAWVVQGNPLNRLKNRDAPLFPRGLRMATAWEQTTGPKDVVTNGAHRTVRGRPRRTAYCGERIESQAVDNAKTGTEDAAICQHEAEGVFHGG